MIPHEKIRARYYKSAKRESLKVLNSYTLEFMQRVRNCNSVGEIHHEASKPIDDKRIEELLTKIYTSVGGKFAQVTIKDVNAKKAAGDIDYWSEFFRIYVKSKAANKIKWITETTEEVFKSTVKNLSDLAGAEGWGFKRLADEIQKSLNFTNAYRAERIARTEIIAASNAGTIEGARQSGIATKKKWLPIVDKFSRPSHAAMEGKPAIDLDEPFLIDGEQMMQPGDGSAEQVINCRCALDIVADESYESILNR